MICRKRRDVPAQQAALQAGREGGAGWEGGAEGSREGRRGGARPEPTPDLAMHFIFRQAGGADNQTNVF